MRKVWHALAVIAACAALFLLNQDWDRIEIEAERVRRLAYAANGAPLPGTPDLKDFSGRLAAHGVALGAPVFIRIFKREFELFERTRVPPPVSVCNNRYVVGRNDEDCAANLSTVRVTRVQPKRVRRLRKGRHARSRSQGPPALRRGRV